MGRSALLFSHFCLIYFNSVREITSGLHCIIVHDTCWVCRPYHLGPISMMNPVIILSCGWGPDKLCVIGNMNVGPKLWSYRLNFAAFACLWREFSHHLSSQALSHLYQNSTACMFLVGNGIPWSKDWATESNFSCLSMAFATWPS